MKKNYLASIIGIGLVSGSMTVGADTWSYNPESDLIDHYGNFAPVQSSEREMFDLGNASWAYDESRDIVVYRTDNTRTIPASAEIGSQNVDKDQLYAEALANFLDQ